MARIRTIKPEFWTDSFMVQLPPLARLIYIALWTAADDHGLLPDEPERLSMEVMPREDALEFEDWLDFFVASGRIEQYVSESGESFFKIAKWESHQRVDKPSKSKVFREGSRKLAIPLSSRRALAEKYSCPPGGEVEASCYYCEAPGRIHWHSLYSGRPSSWVTFPGLEIDHLEPEASGGLAAPENLVLACRNCNRSKGTSAWYIFLCRVNSVALPHENKGRLAKAREGSCEEQGTGNREQGRERGSEQDSEQNDPPVIELPTNITDEFYPITKGDLTQWTADFPNVDVPRELRKMRSWLDANTRRRKTKTGMKRFVVNWLSREQDKPKIHPVPDAFAEMDAMSRIPVGRR